MKVTSKPCPFCGCSVTYVRESDDHERRMVSCRMCGAEGPTVEEHDDAEDDAIELWNVRGGAA